MRVFPEGKSVIPESLKTARQKYGDLADELKDLDPSKNFKYIEFICKAFPEGMQSSVQADIVTAVLADFDKLVSKGLIKQADINAYASWEELSTEVEAASQRTTSGDVRRQSKADADVILDKTHMDNHVLIVMPKTEEASIAYGKGTKWCTAATTSENYFEQYYIKNLITLYYVLITLDDGTSEKYAFAVYPDGKQIEAFDEEDNSVDVVDTLERISKIIDIWFDDLDHLLVPYNIEERKLMKYTHGGTLNNGRWDFDEDVHITDRSLTELPIPYGIIDGHFVCNNLTKLRTLKNAPTKVYGHCDFHYCNLDSLEGGPGDVTGTFRCDQNNLENLKGAPKNVGMHFTCTENQLISLEGGPEDVDGQYSCSRNKLKTLRGAPQEVGGSFLCSQNQLESLEGAPEYVGGIFNCASNQLTSLEGAPKYVDGEFDCRRNPLESFDGLGEVNGDFFGYVSETTKEPKMAGKKMPEGKSVKKEGRPVGELPSDPVMRALIAMVSAFTRHPGNDEEKHHALTLANEVLDDNDEGLVHEGKSVKKIQEQYPAGYSRHDDLDDLLTQTDSEQLLDALVRALSNDQAYELFEYIRRMWELPAFGEEEVLEKAKSRRRKPLTERDDDKSENDAELSPKDTENDAELSPKDTENPDEDRHYLSASWEDIIEEYGEEEADMWKDDQFTPDEVHAWKEAASHIDGFSSEEAMEWKVQDFDPDDYEKWLDVDYEIDDPARLRGMIDFSTEEAVKFYLDEVGWIAEDNFEESYQGHHEEGLAGFAQHLVDEGALDKETLEYHIDWESVARELEHDYFEFMGHVYRQM